jgi:DNA repair exonuclease SbcCD ATPase subunit
MIKTIEISNFCGIERVKLDCKKFNVFKGMNLQGKSTILLAIKWGMFGANDDSLIRKGADTCEVILHTDNGSRVERRLSIGGTSKLFVYTPDNAVMPEPQKFLKARFNMMAFDPMSMLLMNDKDTGMMISKALSQRLKLTPEDIKKYEIQHLELGEDPVTAIQAYHKTLFDERTDVNRTIAAHETKTKDVKYKDVTEEEINAVAFEAGVLEAEISKIKEHNAKVSLNKKNVEIRLKAQANVKELTAALEAIPLETLDETKKRYSQLVTEIKPSAEDKYAENKNSQKMISATLTKIGAGEVKCPIDPTIKCGADINGYRDRLAAKLKELESSAASLFDEVTKASEEIIKLKGVMDAQQEREKISIQLERAKSLVGELQIYEGEETDCSDQEEALYQVRLKLEDMRRSFSIKGFADIDAKKERQAKLNTLLDDLNNFLKVEIPQRQVINVTGITFEEGKLLFQGLPLARLGDSYKLRICTAILKDLYPTANTFTLDRSECIDPPSFKKYVEKCASDKDKIQYFASYVGQLESTHANVNIVTMEKFKVKA